MNEIQLITSVGDLNERIEIAEQELHSLKCERFEVLLALKEQGVPLRVLGSILGVTRQRAGQLLDAYELSKLRQNQPSS